MGEADPLYRPDARWMLLRVNDTCVGPLKQKICPDVEGCLTANALLSRPPI